MTTNKIRETLRLAGKSIETAQLYRYFRQFNIRPLAVRQRPQQYPAEAATIILQNLGLAPAAPLQTKKQQLARVPLASMATLRAEKKKAKK